VPQPTTLPRAPRYDGNNAKIWKICISTFGSYFSAENFLRRTKGIIEKITHEELDSLYHSRNVSRAMTLLTGPDRRRILRKEEVILTFATVIAKHHGNRLRHGWESNIKMDLRK
jgi:hypothetical protein